ncbi:MAG: DUF2029 domain-containing protein [Chloroflexi bacterium]|nr:DUF2029 domain-containing protein [Chloroflexota bacterium]
MDVERDGLGRLPLPADDGRPSDHHGVVADLRSRTVALAIAAAGILVAILTMTEWPARDYRHGDLFQYWAGAHALLEGADPYDLAWWIDFHARSGSRALTVVPQPAEGPAWTTAYPLWTLVAFVPFALLPFALASALWLVAQMAAVAAGVVALMRTCLRTAPRRDGAVLVGLAVAFQPLWLLPGNGNITGFLFGALVGAMALRARPGWAGALLGALVLKPQSVVVAAVAILCGAKAAARWRMVLGGAVVVSALVALAFVLRPGWVEGWIRMLVALQRSMGSNATLWTLGRATGIAPLSVIAPLAFVLTLLVWSWARRPAPLLLLAAAVPVSVAVAPHGWTYDQLHLLITAAVVVEVLSRAPAEKRAIGLVALAATAVALPWLLYVVAVGRDTEDWSALVPVSMFALVVACDRLAGTSAGRHAMRPPPPERPRARTSEQRNEANSGDREEDRGVGVAPWSDPRCERRAEQ